MAISNVVASATGGPLTIALTSPDFPHPLTGVLWRYDASGNPVGDTPVGEFTPHSNTVPIGAPSAIKNNVFLLEGAVLETGDDPPVPYRVVVTVNQNGAPLSEEVPEDQGSGKIGKEDIRFSYACQIKVKK